MKKILFAIAAILFMFGTAQAGPFVSGAGGGGGGNTLWGLALEQPDAADDGKYIQYQNASTSWILGTPAGGGDMTIAVWDGDANGYIDLDAGGTNTSLADPNADRIMFWDDSTGAIVWLTLGSGVTIIGTTISVDGLTIGTDVQAWSANLDSWATSAPTASMLALASGATPAYLLGLTSAIQTQIDGKQATDADLTTWAGITPAASAQLYIASGTTSTRLLGVPDFQSGTSDQVLMSAGVGKVPAWGTYKGSTSVVTVGTIATGTWEGTRVDKTHVAQDLDTGNLAAALTFADGDLIDLSGVTMTAGVDEGIAIPWWVDVAPATEKFYMAYDPSGNALYVREPGGWVNVGASAAAPTNAKYLVFGANANLTDERVLTEGLAIDFTDAGSDGGAYTIDFDPTELTGDRTWAAGGAATIAWTWNLSGTDTTITMGSDLFTFSNSVTVSTGKNITLGTTQWNSADEIDGTKIKDADYGHISVDAAGAWTIDSGVVTAVMLASADFGPFTNAAGTITIDAAAIKDTHIDFGSGVSQIDLDDIPDTATYQKVAAADVDGSGHVNKLIVPEGGTVSFAGPTGAVVITMDDASQTLAARNTANTFTENNTFGNADTDTLTIRSLIIGGNSRAVQIAATYAARTYATETNELYVAGDIETPGSIYAAEFHMADGADGTRGITLTSNTALTPTVDQIYFINDVLYFSQAGVQKTPMRLEDAQTATGKKTFQGDIAVGDASNSGTIDIYDGSSNYWQIAVPSLSSDLTLTLPTTAGATGQYLKTTTTGNSAVLSWDTPSASADTTGGTGGVQFNAAGVLTSDAGFVFTTASDKLSLGSSGGSTTGTIDLYYTGTTYAGTITPNSAMSGDVTITLPSYTTTLIGAGANTFTGNQRFTSGVTIDAVLFVHENIYPAAANSVQLGSGTSTFADLFLGDGAVINFNNGDVTLTHSTNKLTFAGASVGYSFDSGVTIYGVTFINGHIYPGAADSYNLGSGTSEFANLYLGDGAIIYGQNDQSATLTSAASLWTANNFSVDTQFKLPSSDAAPTATAGYIRHDSTVTNYTGGAIVYSSGTTPFQIVAMPSAFAAICSDGQFVAYDATLDYWKCVTASGTGDFKADGSVPMTAAIVPNAVNTIALGSAAAEWADLYLGDGAVIYGQNDSSATLTSSASLWTANNFTVAAAGALTIPQSATPTVDAVGEIAFDTTASQLVSYSGTTEVVLGGVTEVVSFTVSGVTDVSDKDDHFIMSLPYNITVKEVSAVQRRNAGAVAGVPTTINIQECTGSAPGTCADLIATDWILSGSTTQTIYKSAQSDFRDTVMVRNSLMKLDVVSGCTDSDLTVTVKYWINRE